LKKNFTSRSKRPYEVVYVPSQSVSIQFNKDKDFKESNFDIIVSRYIKGNNEICGDADKFHRCGSSNTSDCVDKVFVCDKYTQCPDGTDEFEDCDEYSILFSLFFCLKNNFKFV